jgi:hypothetical protein
MVELDPAVEQQLADLPDAEWRALSARVRPPTSSEQLKSVAAKVISDEHQLNSFMAIANPKAFTKENGDVDEAKLTGHLNKLLGGRGGDAPNYGQGSSQVPGVKPGDGGRAALAKRHPPKATPKADATPGPAARIPAGRGAAQELERRYGKGKK